MYLRPIISLSRRVSLLYNRQIRKVMCNESWINILLRYGQLFYIFQIWIKTSNNEEDDTCITYRNDIYICHDIAKRRRNKWWNTIIQKIKEQNYFLPKNHVLWEMDEIVVLRIWRIIGTVIKISMETYCNVILWNIHTPHAQISTLSFHNYPIHFYKRYKYIILWDHFVVSFQ